MINKQKLDEIVKKVLNQKKEGDGYTECILDLYSELIKNQEPTINQTKNRIFEPPINQKNIMEQEENSNCPYYVLLVPKKLKFGIYLLN
jgi:hypothetical protein